MPGSSQPRLGRFCVAASVNEPFWVSSAWAVGLGGTEAPVSGCFPHKTLKI